MAVITNLLISANNGTNGFVSYPIAKESPINITYQLADVREPDKRKGSRSLTIKILGTNEINKLFENSFSFNVTTQNFNKNLKTPVKYIVNGIENFKGDLQLLKVNINADKSIEYECSILGEGGSLFIDIGDKYVAGNPDSADDLDFSSYNHNYDRDTQRSTRSNLGTGLGVLYPFIDNASNGGSDTVWNVSNFIPCFSMYEYIKKIIEKTGRTFTSSILSATDFKNQILYPNINTVTLSISQLADRQFYVGMNTDFTQVSALPYTVIHNNETAPFFDVGAQNNTTTGIVTLNTTGYYNLASKVVFRIKFTHSNATVAYGVFSGMTCYNAIDKQVPLSSVVVNNAFTPRTINLNTFESITNEVATGEIVLNSGEQFKTRAALNPTANGAVNFYTAANVLVTTGTPTYTIELVSGINGTAFYGLATQKTLFEGNAIEVNNALPLKLKQKDLLKSIIQGLNLFIDIDPNDSNNLIIESYDGFYNTTPPLDYGNRTDLDKKQSINPNILEGKRYIFTYKEDNDKFNKLYKETHGEVFGTEQIDVENDFIKAEKKNELIFSATPNAANYGLGIVHPRIYVEENSIKKSIIPNVRWLYCGGVKQSTNPYTYKQFGLSDLTTNDYLYAGHTDDPLNPTIDLNFGTPKEVYYNYINAYFTNNNLYNRYHKDYLNNLINRDGKFVIKNLWLSPKDIYKFSFRNRLFIDGAYYIVNKINNYNPLEESSTEVELIKLLESNVFTPSSFLISSNPNINSGNGVLSAKLNSALNVGSNIQNRGSNCIAIGDNIVIPESCSNITVIGNNITVDEGVSNSSIINTNDVNLRTSNSSIVNNSTITINLLGEATTTNATPTSIVFDTTSGNFDLDTDCAYKIETRLLATDTVTLDSKEFHASGVARYPFGILSYDDSLAPTSGFSDTSMTGCLFSISPIGGSLDYAITGIAATNIKWSVVVDIIKITQ
jgi:hypothetical protein